MSERRGFADFKALLITGIILFACLGGGFASGFYAGKVSTTTLNTWDGSWFTTPYVNATTGMYSEGSLYLGSTADTRLYRSGTDTISLGAGDSLIGAHWVNSTHASTSDLYVNNDVYVQGTNRTDTIAYPESGASYVVWKDGSTYYAKNGHTGAVTSNADAATLIQTCINTISTGGIIKLKSGVYNISTTLIFNGRGISLIGDAGGLNSSTILYLNNGVNAPVILVGTNAGTLARDMVFKDFMIDGNRANNAGADGIVTSASPSQEDGYIENVFVFRARAGFRIAAPYWVLTTTTIDNCTEAGYVVESTAWGISIINGDSYNQRGDGYHLKSIDARVTSSHAQQGDGNGFVVTGTNSILTGCKTKDMGGIGYSITGDRNTLQGCSDFGAGGLAGFYTKARFTIFNGCFAQNEAASGFCVENTSQDVTITNCIISNSVYGIYLMGAYSQQVIRTIITNNNIEGIQKHGIYIESASNSLIANNIIHVIGLLTTNTYDGIYLYHYSTNNIICHNKIYDETSGNRGKYGIEDTSEETNNIYEENYLKNHISGEINIVSATTKAMRNQGYVTENSGSGGSIALHSNHTHITHGLSYTPSAADIGITWTSSLKNCTSSAIEYITSTEFVVRLYDNTGTAKGPSNTVTFSWTVKRNP